MGENEKKKNITKLKEMSEEELEAWEEKLRFLEGDNQNKNAALLIKQGRGWIF